MNTSPKSWLNQLLGAAIVLAVSVWLITWALTAIQPFVPALVIIGLVIFGLYVARVAINRRRYW